MNKHENFLGRWSRLKRETQDNKSPQAPDLPPPSSEEPATVAATQAQQASTGVDETQAAKPFDIAGLPSIDSITEDTDVRAFLQPGVPDDLSRAALRRAWSSDPAIRDFVGPVENGWDFNDPNAIAGFGSIEPNEVMRLLGQAIGRPQPEQPAGETAAPPHNPQVETAAFADKYQSALAADESSSGSEPLANSASPLQRNDKDAAARKEHDAQRR
jgi:hypothetical protein